MDLCNRLVKECKRGNNMRRHKIVLNLNSNAKEHTLIIVGNTKEYIQLLLTKIRVDNIKETMKQRNNDREWKETYNKETAYNQINNTILRIIRSIVVLVMRKKKSLQIDLNPYLKVMSLRMVKVFRVKTKVESEILKSTKDEKICNRVA